MPVDPSDKPSSVGRKHGTLSHVVAVGLLFPVAVGAFVLWIQASLMTGLALLGSSGLALQSNLGRAADGLLEGDYAAGEQAYQEASRAAERTAASANLPAVDLLARIPGLDIAFDNWRRVSGAAVNVVEATGGLISLYGDLAGKSGGPRIFSDGAVNIAMVRDIAPRTEIAGDLLSAAESDLLEVNATTPFARSLDEIRVSALEQMRSVQRSVEALEDIAPVLPSAVGAEGTKRYLVAIGNQAEMRASGGAPLTLVMVEFDDGRISIPIKGQTSTELFPPLNAPVTWFGPGLNPFFPGNPRKRPFVVTNTHPNMMFSAQEMAGSWQGGRFPPVDGVIFLDLTAIAAVLDATGPVQSAVYGEVTGEQLGEILLVDAYREFGQEAAVERQQANQQLLDELLTRLLSGDDLVNAARAMASTAPGRHFQLWMRDARLQELIIEANAAGLVISPDDADWSAIYTQNGNQSKVDVFQQRNVLVRVDLAEDGSARVTQLLTLTNNTPPDRPEGPPERIGYETMWLKNAYLLYVPNAARDLRANYPDGFSVRPFRNHSRQQLGNGWVEDGFGNRLLRIVGWTPPGGQSTLSINYQLPPGTFVSERGLTYRLTASPQPLFVDPTLTVQVTAPRGYRPRSQPGMQIVDSTATVSAILDRTVDVALEFRP